MTLKANKFLSFLLALALVIEPMAAARAEGNAAEKLSTPEEATEPQADPQALVGGDIVTEERGALPVLEQEITIHDAEAGDENVVIDFADAYDADQAESGKAWLKEKLTNDARNGVETALIATSVEGDSPDQKLDVSDPAEYGVTPENLATPVIELSKWQKFRSWVAEKIDGLKDRAEKAASYLTLAKYDQILKDQIETDVRVATPLPIRLINKKAEKTMLVKKSSRTFAYARFGVVGSAAAIGFYFSRGMDHNAIASFIACAITSMTWGYGSRIIQLVGSKYRAWLNHLGLTSSLLRTAVRGGARLIGKTADQAAKIDQSFTKSQLHTWLHSMLKFVTTEIPFLLAAPAIFAALGIAYFPMTDVANGIDFTTSALFPLNYIGSMALATITSAFQAYISQGFLDTANSNVEAGENHEAAAAAVRGKTTATEARDQLRRIEFKASTRMIVVSAFSNFAVVLSQTPIASLKSTGHAIIYTMTALGVAAYGYSITRFDPKFRRWLIKKSPRLAEALFEGVFKVKLYDYNLCVDLLRPRKRS